MSSRSRGRRALSIWIRRKTLLTLPEWQRRTGRDSLHWQSGHMTEHTRALGDLFVPTIRSQPSIADLLRSTDWATTALGARETWPASLTQMVDVILASPAPMLVLW